MTSKTPQYVIEPLDTTKHVRDSFDCEEPELNEYLKKRARKEAVSGTSTCFVIVKESSPSIVLGYYTLSNASIALADLPEKLGNRLPRYDQIPVTLLGRIARSLSSKGANIGAMLMMHALKQALRASMSVGSTALILDPKNDNVAKIYEKWGFKRLENSQMILPMKDIETYIKKVR